jgi:serine/threonine protein phosphatase PrpC
VRFLRAYEDAFLRCNQQLHDSNVNDNRSGTTAISVVVWAHTLQVANVGDSRAIVCTVVSELEEEGDGSGRCRRIEGQRRLKVKARALSSDHTPFRKDERERVKSFGARVMTVNQVLCILACTRYHHFSHSHHPFPFRLPPPSSYAPVPVPVPVRRSKALKLSMRTGA